MDRREATELLEKALDQVAFPAGSGIILEGSIAEDFGNPSSDVDFLIVPDNDEKYPMIPTVLFIDGHRVEFRFRSASQVRRHATRLNAVPPSSEPKVTTLTADELDVYHRFAYAWPMRNEALIGELQAMHDREHLSRLTGTWLAAAATKALRQAAAMLHLRRDADAIAWARSAVLQAARAFAARAGQSYIAAKWVSVQVRRAGIDEATERELWSLYSAQPADAASYVEACAALAARIGVRESRLGEADLRLKRRRNVLSWPIAGNVYAIRQPQAIYSLSPQATAVWRSLVFDVPLPEALAEADCADPELARRILGELHRHGLLALGGAGLRKTWTRSDEPPAPQIDGPLLNLYGFAAPEHREHVQLLPLPAERFVAAGVSFTWANLMLENAREDAVGAYEAQQWKVLEAAFRQMATRGCVMLLCAYGVAPQPPLEEAVVRISELPGIDRWLVDEARALQSLDIRGPADVPAANARIEAFVERLRSFLRGGMFPTAFESSEAWRGVLEIGYDWVRFGAFLGVPFPSQVVPEDFLASRGGRAQVIPTAAASADEGPRELSLAARLRRR
jgi:hypothetical protein